MQQLVVFCSFVPLLKPHLVFFYLTTTWGRWRWGGGLVDGNDGDPVCDSVESCCHWRCDDRPETLTLTPPGGAILDAFEQNIWFLVFVVNLLILCLFSCSVLVVIKMTCIYL